jgi:hypothetical protein
MEKLNICTWMWGYAYQDYYIRRLANSVHRNLTRPHKFICFTDRSRHLPGIIQHEIRDKDLIEIKGCFARLRLFDPYYLEEIGIERGEKIVNLDLDLVVTGPLDPLFDGDAEFTILQGINSTNPCPYNGSAWMFRAGTRPDVWDDFSLLTYAARKVPFHSFPDDQGWFWHKFPKAAAWGPGNGVYGFKKVGWSPKESSDSVSLPPNAVMVAFPGWRDPSKFTNLDWVQKHWQ